VGSAIIGQALYSRTSTAYDGAQTYGFVAASPSLLHRMPWLDTEARGITTFAGGGRQMGEAERASYAPVGRHAGERSVFGYRKTAVADDAQPPDRYIVHVLVMDAPSLTLSEVLRIGSGVWLDGSRCPLGATPQLADLPIGTVAGPPRQLRCGPHETPHIRKVVEGLAHGRSMDVTGFTGEQLRAVMACLPAWCDIAADLAPKWIQSGPNVMLSLSPFVTVRHAPWDRRDYVEDAALLALRVRLDAARDPDELAHAMAPGRLPPRTDTGATVVQLNAGIAAARAGSVVAGRDPLLDDPAPAAIRTWLDRGSRALTTMQRELLTTDPQRTLQLLRSRGLRLPSGRRPDQVAVDILVASPGASADLVASVLPAHDPGVVAYLTCATTPAMRKACLLLNASHGRRIEIPVTRAIPDATFEDLVESGKSSTDRADSLVRRLIVSMRRMSALFGRSRRS
jgi:hypothetical protein